jgi:isoquinoline 1-oxidoreductase alpha subunit
MAGASPPAGNAPMAPVRLTVNGVARDVDVAPDTPLLWVLRDVLGLTGTKYGCGAGICGACAVRMGDRVIRSCQLTIAEAAGRSFVTIEHLAAAGGEDVQKAWIEADVAHCGYCQAGLLIAASVLAQSRAPLDDDAIDAALGGHLCRCGSYPRVRKAMKLVARSSRKR